MLIMYNSHLNFSRNNNHAFSGWLLLWRIELDCKIFWTSKCGFRIMFPHWKSATNSPCSAICSRGFVLKWLLLGRDRIYKCNFLLHEWLERRDDPHTKWPSTYSSLYENTESVLRQSTLEGCKVKEMDFYIQCIQYLLPALLNLMNLIHYDHSCVLDKGEGRTMLGWICFIL